MPIYTYRCREHGGFDHTVWGVAVAGIPDTMPCPRFMRNGRGDSTPCPYTKCRRVLTLPAAVIVQGGTGARRGR